MTRLLLCLLALLGMAHAQTAWDSPSADLAKQIAALTGPGTITLTITNRSTIATDEVPAIRKSLEREIRAAGITVRAKDADSDVRVTLSENLQGWLWVAEIQEGSETRVVMLPVSGATVAATTNSSPAVTLRANLLLSQKDPILDAGLINQNLIVLEAGHIKSYNVAGANWQLATTYDISHSQPLPRDLRGRLIPAADHPFDAYLPGIVCTATKEMTVSCNPGDDPWPLGSQKALYNPNRNFFTGVLVPGFGPKLPPFFSAAELPRAGGTTYLFADVTGAVHIFENGTHKLMIGIRDWGSDIAAVHSDCANAALVLASAAGWPAADSLRAYQITGREATPVSAPLAFDGTITALWPAGDQATVVVQNMQQSRYEVYSVSLACSR
ncbi:MAG TPA: hypothetical protein VKB58_06575 [Terriglobales bacterium]|jgi:hypothetical protein|nr:hypothetical protein [Terriglobales bacterium]